MLTREGFPTFRVDVDKLFGKELIGRNHEIDFVMQASAPDIKSGPTSWRGRTVWVGGAAKLRGPLRRAETHIRSFVHDVRCLLRLARCDRYDAVQVRNKFLVGALACFIAAEPRIEVFLLAVVSRARISSAERARRNREISGHQSDASGYLRMASL